MKPNILLIMTDQHRGDCLGCNGNSFIETPNIDFIASGGTTFLNAYSPSPSCVPARACLMTGMTPWNTGILGMGRGQKPMGTGFMHTIPGELSRAGYHTQGIGKMHFDPQRSLLGFHNTILDESGRVKDKGFVSDYMKWFEENKTGSYGMSDHAIDWNSWMARPYHAPEYLHPTNWTVNEAIGFLNRRDPEKPFFLKVSFARPHSPYDPPQHYYDLYIERDIPEPYIGDWASMHDDPVEAKNYAAWRGKRSKTETRRARAAYYGSITHIDSQIGRLLIHIRKSGLFENTIIIFTSDHGDMLGDHNLWRKTYAYEGSARIPMILRLPSSMGKPLSNVNMTPVSLYDIMPTFLEAAGVPIPDTVEGISMIGMLKDNKSHIGSREYIHGEHSTCYSEEQEMQYMTDGKFKYIWFPRLGTEQLFNIAEDRSEKINLAGLTEYLPELSLWRKRMIKEMEPRGQGLVDENGLVCQAGKSPMVSPNYKASI